MHLIRLRAKPGEPMRGLLLGEPVTVPVALGRAGIRRGKREGDGATPAGRFRAVRLWWRADRAPRPRTRLPVRAIARDLAWDEDPASRTYNRPVRRDPGQPGDRLWRADALYDYVIELDHNTRPRVAGRGSAVFVHVARAGLAPTAGCVAMTPAALRALLARLGPRSRIDIQ